jgi:2-oxoisovalerate dehydrogenase E1 component beta subunit
MLYSYLDAVKQSLVDALNQDDQVFLMGEDIASYGGAFKVTEGLLDQFGQNRIIDTPIAEGGIIGTAIGAALAGMKPIVEMQFMDFISCGFNQITNFAAKCHYRWGAQVPLVIRGPGGGLVGGGPFHSQAMEMYFVKTAGLKVVMPSTTQDAYSLLQSAIADPNPVIFIEHKALYRAPYLKVKIDPTMKIPLGQAIYRRTGQDLVIITYSAMVHRALEACQILQEQGINCAVLDLRTLNPLDDEAIISAVKKYHKVLILHEDTMMAGIAGEIAMRIQANAFEWLDAPIMRLTSADTPVPYHPDLEAVFAPSVEKIVESCRSLHHY